jgi:hypothetical protein
MHAEHVEALAAIGLGLAAGDAGAAGQIGQHRDGLARRQGAAGAGLVDLAGKFMTDDAGIFEIGLGALENMQIRPAHAGAAQSHPGFTGLQRGLGPFDDLEFARISAQQRSHCRGHGLGPPRPGRGGRP